MEINQHLVRFNRVLTKEISKKVLNILNVRKLLFSESKPSINRVKITEIDREIDHAEPS